jgi:multidrug efflux system membrane fusion protein
MAGVFALLLLGWLYSGQFRGDAEPAAGDTAQAATPPAVVSVRGRKLEAEPRIADLIARGRTEAERTVALAAETEAAVVNLPFERGARVVEGDLICELAVDGRDTRLSEAQALERQRAIEFEAARKLRAKEFRSEVQEARSRAELEAARAAVRFAEVELARTQIRAPFDGILDTRPAEIGMLMRIGDVCGTVVDLDPIHVVAQVSEQEVGALTMGDTATATLATGETIEGPVHFIAAQADGATRTFRTEIQAPNADFAIKDGITAELRVPVRTVEAHLLSPAALTLDDTGVLGVRTVEEGNRVAFLPVKVVAREERGIWVEGLPNPATVITVGQEFVTDGQIVDVDLELEGLRP